MKNHQRGLPGADWGSNRIWPYTLQTTALLNGYLTASNRCAGRVRAGAVMQLPGGPAERR